MDCLQKCRMKRFLAKLKEPLLTTAKVNLHPKKVMYIVKRQGYSITYAFYKIKGWIQTCTLPKYTNQKTIINEKHLEFSNLKDAILHKINVFHFFLPLFFSVFSAFLTYPLAFLLFFPSIALCRNQHISSWWQDMCVCVSTYIQHWYHIDKM